MWVGRVLSELVVWCFQLFDVFFVRHLLLEHESVFIYSAAPTVFTQVLYTPQRQPRNVPKFSGANAEVDGRTQVEPRLPSLLQKAMAGGLHQSCTGEGDFLKWKNTFFFLGVGGGGGGMEQLEFKWFFAGFGGVVCVVFWNLKLGMLRKATINTTNTSQVKDP